MELIKIYPDRVQIKSNSRQLAGVRINNAVLVRDEKSGASLVCLVEAISRAEEQERFDFNGELLESDPSSMIDCSIIGSLKNGKFVKSVDQYPSSDVRIEMMWDEAFGAMLAAPESAAFRIGQYANYDCPAYLDGNRFFQRHSAILGSTGSGKSCAEAGMLEKLAQLKSANVILFDLHGEYAGLSYVRRVEIGNNGLAFPMWFLPLKDVYSNLLRIKEESAQLQVAALRRAFYQARDSKQPDDVPVPYSLEELIFLLEKENTMEILTGEAYKTGARAGEAKTVKGENYGKLSGVISLLRDKQRDARYDFMTQDKPQQYLYRFVRELYGTEDKNIKVLDLSNVPSEIVPVIIAVTARMIYKVHMQQDRDRMLPLNLICDEAHNYIPSETFGLGASQRRLLDVFETIAKEGRKFGVSLTVISQRPSELNRTILSQCANYIVLKLTNEEDKQIIRGVLPEGGRAALNSVSLFQPGECLAIGDSAGIPMKIRMDLPKEQPDSRTVRTWDVWSEPAELFTDRLVDRILEG